jgi:hypothetical protein
MLRGRGPRFFCLTYLYGKNEINTMTRHLKAISTVIATLALLLITIAIIGSAYNFIYGYFRGLTSRQIEVTDMRCNSKGEARIIVKNMGTDPLSTSMITVMDANTGKKIDDANIVWSKTGSGIDLSTGLAAYYKFDEADGTVITDSPDKGNDGTLETGAVLFMNFDEGSGNITNDSSGNGNNGTLISSGNLVKNGDAEKGTLDNWLYFDGVSSTDPYSGSYRFYRIRSATVTSKELIPIDLSKKYYLSGWFKSFGTAGQSKIYFGFAPYDINKEPISPQYVKSILNTETVLCTNINAADKTIYIKNASNWETYESSGYTVYYDHVAFNIRLDFTDLPNKDLSSQNITTKQKFASCPAGTPTCPSTGECWSITFNTNVGKAYSEGIPIREHKSGAGYMYSAASSVNVPPAWTENKTTSPVQGESQSDTTTAKWWHGTKYATILILANHGQSSGDYNLGVDNISLTTDPPTYTGPARVAGINGNALNFSGWGDDYVNVGAISQLNEATQFTVSAWIKPNAIPKNQEIVQRGSSNDVHGYFYFTTDGSGKIVFDVEDKTTAAHVYAYSQSPLSAGAWHHVVGVASGSDVKVYVDDVAGSSVAYNGLYSLVTGGTEYYKRANIGVRTYNSETPTRVFNGTIDEVAIYKRALSADEVGELHSAQKAKFLEHVAGKENNGLRVYGAGDYVSVGGPAPWNTLHDISVSFWFKANDINSAGYDWIFNKFVDESSGWGIAVYDSEGDKIGIYNDIAGVGADTWFYPTAVSENTWYHVVAVMKNKENKLYIDGVSVGSGSSSSSDWASFDGNLYVGSRSNTEGYFNGIIDDVKIYSRALNDEEIKKLAGVAPAVDVAPSGIVTMINQCGLGNRCEYNIVLGGYMKTARVMC